MLNRIFLFFLFHFAFVALSQPTCISEELRFSAYLIDNSEYKDALVILHKAGEICSIENNSQLDSINFYTGWAYYHLKTLDSSAYYFNKVGDSSAFYFFSKFYQAFDNIYLGNYEEAKTILSSLSTRENEEMDKLKNLEFSGIYLLERNYALFDSISKKFDFSFYPISQEQENFIVYRSKLLELKDKSPLLAGLLSALFPGAGKFYAGYRGQALSAMMPSLMLAAVAIESLFKAGYYSAPFVIFGGFFSMFYFGNIWGSAISVKTKRFEIEYETDQNILLDLHLPLRRIFN